MYIRVTLAVLLAASIQPAWAKAHVINVLADKDSHFKIPGQKEKQITVKAGGPLS